VSVSGRMAQPRRSADAYCTGCCSRGVVGSPACRLCLDNRHYVVRRAISAVLLVFVTQKTEGPWTKALGLPIPGRSQSIWHLKASAFARVLQSRCWRIGPAHHLETRRYEARAGFTRIAKNRWYVFGCVFAPDQTSFVISISQSVLGAVLVGLSRSNY
jgi:hypothetical protein